jgi:hypothetical protein
MHLELWITACMWLHRDESVPVNKARNAWNFSRRPEPPARGNGTEILLRTVCLDPSGPGPKARWSYLRAPQSPRRYPAMTVAVAIKTGQTMSVASSRAFRCESCLSGSDSSNAEADPCDRKAPLRPP